MPAPDYSKINELERDFGLPLTEPPSSPSPPRGGTQNTRAADSILKSAWSSKQSAGVRLTTLASLLRQVWTDDLVRLETGEPGTRLLTNTNEPLSYALVTEGFEHVTHIRIEPQPLLVDDRGWHAAINQELQDACEAHRAAIRQERLHGKRAAA